MPARKKQLGNYAKNKIPYTYKFKKCSHEHTEPQRVLFWRGTICAVCNIIVTRERSSGYHER